MITGLVIGIATGFAEALFLGARRRLFGQLVRIVGPFERRDPPSSAVTSRASWLLVSLGILACGGSDRDAPARPDGAAPAEEAWCRDGLPAGAEVVLARSEGAWDRDGGTPRLVELWRAGGVNEGEELSFPIGIAASPEGWIAIPDWTLGEVIVVAPDGSWRGSWTRQGEGPGEVLRPVAAAWGDDGTLAVFDVEGPKVARVREGESVREDLAVSLDFTGPVVASGQLEWAGLAFDGTAYLQRPPHPRDPSDVVEEPGTRLHTAVLRLRPGAGVADTVANGTVPVLGTGPFSSLTAPGWPRLHAAVGPDGTLAIGGLDSLYRIDVSRPSRDAAPGPAGGRVLQRICRATPPLPLTSSEFGQPRLGQFEGEGNERARQRREAIRAAPRPETPAPYGDLFLGAGGRLWVQRDRPVGAGLWTEPGALFDVFDADGTYLGDVRAPERARLLAAAGDTVWAFETGEYDETWVVAYELEVRRGPP